MGKKFERQEGEVELDADWSGRQTRIVLISVALLFALVYTQVLFTHKFAEPGLFLKMFSWLVCVYFFWVLITGIKWGWKAHRLAKHHARGESGGVDTLTGLPNWQGTAAKLAENQWGEVQDRQQIWLLYVELIGLEGTNYEHGRTAGDMLLKEISRIIQSHVPDDGMVGRVGGSEFIIALPRCADQETEDLGEELRKQISSMTVDLGPWGQISGLHLRTETVPYKPGKTTLSQVMSSIHSSQQSSESVSGFEGTSEKVEMYHLPEITLEAFAVHRWSLLSQKEMSQYQTWRWNPTNKFINIMVADLMDIVEMRVQKGDIDVVTAPPLPASEDQRKAAATHAFGKAFAKQLGIPFKRTLKSVVSGAVDTKHVDAQLDTSLADGSGVILVQDLITTPRILRRSVRELSTEGCHVLVLGWAFDAEAGVEGRGIQTV